MIMAVEKVISETELLKHKVYIAARDGKAATVIEVLRNLNRDSVVQEILDHHTEDDGQNTTPLIIAARNGHEHVVLVLLRLRATVEQTGTAEFYKQIVKEVSPLWCAAFIGHLGIVKLLIEYGANVNQQTSKKSTPLRAACFDNHLEVVKYLMEHNADLHALNSDQENCLSMACYKGHYSLAEYLIQKGADLNRKTSFGWTALHKCADNGHVEVIDLLLKHGANITTNGDNMTPLMLAALNGKADAVEYFISQTKCYIKDTINALELLGTTFAVTKYYDIEKAYYYFVKAMKERYNSENNVIDKNNLPPVPAYDNWIECKTLQELETIKTDYIALQMESLVIRQRILGPGHKDTIRALVYMGDVFADNMRYDKCIHVLHYALQLSRETQTYFISRFPETFADMIEKEMAVQLKVVLDIFEKLTTKIASIMLRIIENKEDIDSLQEHCEDINETCVYLVGLMLHISNNAHELDFIHRAVYKFIRQNPRMCNGFSPLHMCCASAAYTKYDPLHDRVPFPNASMCKTFITCGGNVNATDNRNNTPLHTVVRCADAVNDFDTLYEILNCLLENGAHVDICNRDGKTPVDVAKTAVVKSILMANRELSLRCLAATAVRRNGVQYKGTISKDLQEFVELH